MTNRGISNDTKEIYFAPDHLEIIDHCYLPNAIKSLAPEIELKYKYTGIKGLLAKDPDVAPVKLSTNLEMLSEYLYSFKK